MIWNTCVVIYSVVLVGLWLWAATSYAATKDEEEAGRIAGLAVFWPLCLAFGITLAIFGGAGWLFMQPFIYAGRKIHEGRQRRQAAIAELLVRELAAKQIVKPEEKPKT